MRFIFYRCRRKLFQGGTFDNRIGNSFFMFRIMYLFFILLSVMDYLIKVTYSHNLPKFKKILFIRSAFILFLFISSALDTYREIRRVNFLYCKVAKCKIPYLSVSRSDGIHTYKMVCLLE